MPGGKLSFSSVGNGRGGVYVVFVSLWCRPGECNGNLWLHEDLLA